MSNGWSVGCKIVAWLILIVGILTGIIISIKFTIWWPVLSITPGALITFLLFGVNYFPLHQFKKMVCSLTRCARSLAFRYFLVIS